MRVFVAEIKEIRKQKRLEAAIMQNVYSSKEPWSELADRGMHLEGRYNCELPVEIENICENKIYGIPEKIEI